MKIGDFNFEKVQDKAISKCLMRSFKEGGNLMSVRRRFNGYHQLISRCYVSRKSHGSESVSLNVSYWPDDIGVYYDSTIARFIYYALLACNIKFENFSGLSGRLVGLFENIMYNPSNAFDCYDGDIFSYRDIILKAFKNNAIIFYIKTNGPPFRTLFVINIFIGQKTI